MATGKRVGKLSGLKQDGLPNAYWRKFKERLNLYIETPIEQWKEEHFLGYILNKYKEQMDAEYPLSYSGPPTKSKEIYCIRRMILGLGTENPVIIKAYIDWVFETKIQQKVIVSSIAFFFTTDFILKFKQFQRQKNKVTRVTQLPDNYKCLAESLEIEINTYGDLAFAKVAIENDPQNELYTPYQHLFAELVKLGFNEKLLQGL
jgi:hypothetical protein